MTPKQKLRKAARMTGKVAVCLALIDLVILLTGLLQIALSGETGHWASFWRVQVEFLIWALP